MNTHYRTHTCGELSTENVGEEVLVSGWVHSVRDHGGLIFVDLRDRYGITQIVVHPEKEEIFPLASTLKNEFVIQVSGMVSAREKSAVNPRLSTGEIEVSAKDLKILSESKLLPFEITTEDEINEQLRLKYRYLDLRREKLQTVLKKRHELISYARKFFYERNFLEVQTPLLTGSTPEGARDFLVPSRINPGTFFALPQSPQQYKQLLMISGFDRYVQIAPCLRDEDPRADRLYGDHYQIDLEMSFVDQHDAMDLISDFYVEISTAMSNKKIIYDKNGNIPRMKFDEVLQKYASDKPDLRYDIEISDVKDIFGRTEFTSFKNSNVVRAIVAPDAGEKFSRKEIEAYQKMVQDMGAGGLAYVKVSEGDILESGISKFIAEDLQKELIQRTEAKSGDILFFVADESFDRSNVYLDRVRRSLGKDLDLIDENSLAYLWVVDFPFFELSDDGDLDIAHNPFSKPTATFEELENMTKEELLEVKAMQYDFVCNGYELLSGGERNYDAKILAKMFRVLGYSESEVKEKFGHMLEAFSYGAPPTAGAGIGLERTLMILTGEENVRNIIAFPKDGKGNDPMFGSPSEARETQLKELGIEIKRRKKK